MNLNWRDVVDILAVSTVLYYTYGLLAETRAMNLVRGLIVYVLVWFAAVQLRLTTLSWLLGNAATLGMFALIVVFQPELRGVLERLGRGRLRENRLDVEAARELLRAIERMAARRLGALIALERRTPLGEYAITGELLNARVSARLLETIFTVGTPLHDGGVIMRGRKLTAAGCVFPLSDRDDLKYLGTRHRAAVGLSESTDAFVIVVSEERGTIRVAERGRLSPNLTPSELKDRLREVLDEAI